MEKKHKSRIGRVVSNRMDKTVVISVESRRRHPLYKKTVKHTSRFKAHDEENACLVGDIVRIVETRPLSKEKHWLVCEILKRKGTAEVRPEEIG